ncbi:unnamed protein product [Schistosoma haematobium]|nr:unnamed protein product [Schistosoma haematobium]CAH8663221.1 unnamed protein product [Schistosoma haematobium]
MEQNKETLLTEIRSRINEMNSRTLYLRKLPRNTSLSQLKALCRSSANGRLLNPSRHLKHRHCRVIFTNQKDALEAFNTRHGVILHDTPINLNFDLRSRKSSLLVRAPIVATITDPKVLSNEKPKLKSRKSSSHLNQQQSRGNKSLTESPSGPVKNSNLEANKSKRKKYKNESASSNSVPFSLATNHGHQVSKPVPKKRKLV